MKEKLRKLHCEEMLTGRLNNASLKECRNMCGFYEPIPPDKKGKQPWEVRTMWEGEGYEAQTQFEAEMISSLEQIKSMLLQERMRKKK